MKKFDLKAQPRPVDSTLKRTSRDGKNDLSGSQLEGGSSTQMIGSKIARLQETGLFYKKKIQAEGSKLEQLEQEIKEKQDELNSLRKELMDKRKSDRKRQGTELHITDQCDPVVLSNKIALLKQKINQQKTKLNEQVSQNKYFKDQINTYREEKEICNDIHHKLELDLAVAKNKLRESIQDRDRIKTEKRECLSQLQASKQQRAHQRKEFEKQFHSVFKMLDEENRDQRLEEAGLKKRKQDMNQSEENFFDDFEASPGKASTMDDPLKKKNKDKTRIKNTEVSEQDLKEKKKQVEEYQKIFESLKSETNSKNIDEIVKKFVDYQDENYALFNYINTIRDEYENLNKEKTILQKQVSKLEKEQREPSDEKDPKTKKFKELTREITQVKNRRIRYEDEYKKLKQIINQLKISVPIMFDRIGCNSEEYTRELGGGTLNAKDIEESNMLQILAVIEKRTNDLLQLYSVAYKSGDNKNSKGLNDDSNQSFSNYVQKHEKRYEEFLPGQGSEPVKKAWANNYDDAYDRIQKLKDDGLDKSKNKDLFIADNEKKTLQEQKLDHRDFVRYVEEKVIRKNKDGNQKNQNAGQKK